MSDDAQELDEMNLEARMGSVPTSAELHTENQRLKAELETAYHGQMALQRLNSDIAHERNQWQHNHKNVVERLRLATQRKDLPVDRIPAINRMYELQEQVEQLTAELAEAVKVRNEAILMNNTERHRANELQQELAALRSQQAAVPVGYKLVPVKPTAEMLRVGNSEIENETAREVWEAMLTASPACWLGCGAAPEFDSCQKSPTGKHSESWFVNGDCDHCKTGAIENAPLFYTATQPSQPSEDSKCNHNCNQGRSCTCQTTK